MVSRPRQISRSDAFVSVNGLACPDSCDAEMIAAMRMVASLNAAVSTHFSCDNGSLQIQRLISDDASFKVKNNGNHAKPRTGGGNTYNDSFEHIERETPKNVIPIVVDVLRYTIVRQTQIGASIRIQKCGELWCGQVRNSV